MDIRCLVVCERESEGEGRFWVVGIGDQPGSTIDAAP
jgi:hypothetical protein